MSGLRRVARAALPDSLVVARRRWLLHRTEARFRGASNADIFSSIYADGHWGSAADGFSSGDGSHDPERFVPYLAAVTGFLAQLPTKPDTVDLGCGDFHIGVQVRPYCGRYVACDVVPDLVERNRRLPGVEDIEFRCLDITRDALPDGEVVMIRQVFQHLANADIARVVGRLAKYRYAVVTDHQPAGPFVPNADIPSGPHIRVGIGSAVDLAAEPFGLPFVESRELCVVPGDRSGVIRTTLYRLW